MKTFRSFLKENDVPQIRLKKEGHFGGHYTGTHKGFHFEIWKSVYHTDTSRLASRANQRQGYGSYASSRKDTVWNWRGEDGRIHDGFGTKKSALQNVADYAERREGRPK